MHLRSDGQLALLDAVVFFAVSVVVSSVMLSYGESLEDLDLDDGEGSANPEEILKAFMNTCIGFQITIHAEGSFAIPEREMVSVCLAMEVEAILDGVDKKAFVELENAFTVILRRITNPVLQPHLVVLDMDSSASRPVLQLPQDSHPGGDVLAASAVFPCGERTCLVEVLLSSQAFPEPVNV